MPTAARAAWLSLLSQVAFAVRAAPAIRPRGAGYSRRGPYQPIFTSVYPKGSDISREAARPGTRGEEAGPRLARSQRPRLARSRWMLEIRAIWRRLMTGTVAAPTGMGTAENRRPAVRLPVPARPLTRLRCRRPTRGAASRGR